MVDFSRSPNEIKETDIVFDCPHCAKSLAIDYRGAGLSIPCTDCGQYVDVPIPDGMELTDLDSSDEEQEVRILNLRRSLIAAEARIAELESKLKHIEAREREQVGREPGDDTRIAAVTAQLDAVQALLGQLVDAFEKLGAAVRGELPDEDA